MYFNKNSDKKIFIWYNNVAIRISEIDIMAPARAKQAQRFAARRSFDAMKKALIFSDSHGYFQGITDAVCSEKNIDLIIFAGDVQRDADNILNSYPQIPLAYVLGNNDWSVHGVPFDKVFEFGGKRFFLTHGHMYHVKSSLYSLRQKAREVGADICVFGHTHIAHCREEDGILMLNPGSAWSSYMVLEINNGEVNVELKQRYK